MRTEFAARVKRAAYARARERCEACGADLVLGKIDFDHVIPCALGGEDTLDNCEVLCRNCHNAKTHKADAPRIAKMKRQRDKHIGIRKPPAFRHPRLRRKVSGEVVERNP